MLIKYFIEEKFYSTKHFSYLGDNFFEQCSDILEVKDKKLKFTYVGLIAFKANILFVLPKYEAVLSSKENRRLLELYLSVLTKCFRSYEFINNVSQEEIHKSTLFDIYINLLDYYNEYGIYSPIQIKKTSSFEDKVLWNQTIENSMPVIKHRKPLYIDVVSIKNKSDNFHLISELQRFATVQAFNKFGRFLNYQVAIDYNPNLVEYNKEQLLHILQAELNQSFIDHNIYLLNLLIDFLNEEGLREQSHLQLFGIKVFYKIWELVCQSVIGDDKSLQEQFFPAVWAHEGQFYNSVGKLQPDIILGDRNRCFVFDAKYYLPVFADNAVKNQPRSESITKQVMYELILKNAGFFDIYNGFIFPVKDDLTNEELIEIDVKLQKGFVQIPSTNLPEIKTLFFPAIKLLNSFLNNKRAVINL